MAVRSKVATNINVPTPPFLGTRVVESVPLQQIYSFINRVALFRGQWQFKRGRLSDAAYAALIEEQVDPLFNRLCRECDAEQILTPQVVYGYFRCASLGDDLLVFDPDDNQQIRERFTFPRQPARKRSCVSDFFRADDTEARDLIGLMCVTMGLRVSERARTLFESNAYSDYLYLHGFGVECAEALAELWHKRMQQEMGLAVDDASSIRDLFAQKYRGSRYSFGYPACPDMSDQENLFRLLKPDRIGCHLTENWQIDPEQSTSAIIAHHPEAKYFNV